ncbi:FtsX-like permease family protein [Polymorphospora sp. NPDC050346]|uniref:FtsX-like permease family protein n=1 Tax=Polymorphospora sp. NPDC050346 TaxID=3155780 RepID=UPI0033C33FB2
MRPSVLLRLSLAGTRTDLMRVVLTAVSMLLATLAVLAALNVLAITTPSAAIDETGARLSTQYSNALLREPGLRGGTALALVLLTIPILALAGQCFRVGAPARERRLAGFRLAGASPRQAVLVAVAETGIAALLGTLAGLGVFLAGRELLHRPDGRGQLPLPTDVLPAAPAVVATVLGLPLLAALVTALLMRRVVVGPLGVVRRSVRTGAPAPWPGILIAVGAAPFVTLMPLSRWLAEQDVPNWLAPLALFLGALFAAAGVILGTGWLSYTAGRLLLRIGRGPATLLAARRLVADPWTGSRTLAALLACMLFAGGAAGVRAWITTGRDLQEEASRADAAAHGYPYDPSGSDFYSRTLDLVDLAVGVGVVIAAGGLLVALAESIVARRRAYAMLVATGVPRRTLAASIVWQVAAPAVPAVGLALVLGAMLPRGIATEAGGGRMETCVDGVCVRSEEVVRPIPVLWDHLLVFGAGGVVTVLVMTAVGLLFLRASTAVEELRVG